MPRTSTTAKAENSHTKPATPGTDDLKFEAALAELEQIVQNMEKGQLPLEESLAAYRRGSELLKHCQHLLSDAERKILILEDGALHDFDANNGGSQ